MEAVSSGRGMWEFTMKIPRDYERREKVTAFCLIRSMPLLARGSFNSLNASYVLGAANMHCHEKSHQCVFRAQDILNLDMAMMDLCVSAKIIVCPGGADCQQIRLSQFHPTKLGSKFRIPRTKVCQPFRAISHVTGLKENHQDH